MSFTFILKDNARRPRFHYYVTAYNILIDRVEGKSFKQIASTKYWSASEAFYQQAFSQFSHEFAFFYLLMS